ncbi:hypothetical protein [Candidatus Caldatribacterium sp.]|uniref:hypothetical protein n=1 Tax=Candidatus Caldatribacterium sp. TaxID=2282143 RepID=UPI003847DD06|nr:hypothetical protein [Candidatus Caldatribacterium sp.]
MLRVKGLTKEQHRCLVCGYPVTPDRLLWPGICMVCNSACYDYWDKNESWTKGNGLRGRYSLSLELELEPHRVVHSFLLRLGFLPTFDRTISEGKEWKSPIYVSSRILRRDLQKIFSLVANKDVVSTHIHIGLYNGKEDDVEAIQDYFRSCGKRLAERIVGSTKNYTLLFGRTFGPYADFDCSTDSKFFWINTIHTNTVEFRLPRFVSYRQALAVINCCLDWMEAARRNAPARTLFNVFVKRLKEVEEYEKARIS